MVCRNLIDDHRFSSFSIIFVDVSTFFLQLLPFHLSEHLLILSNTICISISKTWG